MGCSSYPKKLGYYPLEKNDNTFINPYFSNYQKDYLYKADIAVFNHRFGGILIIKKIDEASHRIAFTTELGNTIFDFTLGQNSFKVNRILKEMNRKMLLSTLESDFRSLIYENIDPHDIYEKGNQLLVGTKISGKNHYYYFREDSLTTIARVTRNKEKVIIRFSEIEEGIARDVQISHKNIKLTISLRAI